MFSSLKFSTVRSRSRNKGAHGENRYHNEDQDDGEVSCASPFRCQQPFSKCSKQSSKIKDSNRRKVGSRDNLATSYPHSDAFFPPNDTTDPSLYVTVKTKDVFIERDDEGTLGLTLQGGLHPNPDLSRPLVVTHVRPDGPTNIEGTIHVGDRLLAIDGFPLDKVTLNEAYNILKNSDKQTSALTIEYDIMNMKRFSSPLLVEMESPHPHQLGLTLTNTPHNTAVLIDEIKPASIAERCGALFPGDQILSVNDTRIEGSRMAATEVHKLLRICGETHTNLLLQILPANVFVQSQTVRKSPKLYYYTEGEIQLDHINTNNYYEVPNEYVIPKTSPIKLDKSGETKMMTVTLHSDERLGYGLSVYSSPTINAAIISFINPGGPADLCEVIQINDRILSINNWPVTGIDNEHTPLHEVPGVHLGTIELLMEYDLCDVYACVNGSIITLELTKYNKKNLGITVTGNHDCMQISEIKKGSVADRCGVLNVGDKILSINHLILSKSTVQEALHMLHSSVDTITLQIDKPTNNNNGNSNESIEYTVELSKRNGSIGLTVSGSDTVPGQIIISALTSGGLAEKTGALHVGDRFLEINGHDVRNVLLSEALSILPNSADKILFKVSRSSFGFLRNDQNDLSHHFYGSPGLLSDDSAVESWESSTQRDISPNDTSFQNVSQDTKNRSGNGNYQVGLVPINVTSQPNSSAGMEEPVYSNITYQQENIDQYNTIPYYDQVPCRNYFPIDESAGNRKCFIDNLYENNNLNKYHEHFRNVDEIFNIADLRDMRELTDHPDDIYQVILFKDPLYEDFGFSISDGLYERGVFLNKIRKGGPADKIGLLKQFDRIVQVNNIRTEDFDCCLTVPLIASAGDRISLTVKRRKANARVN